MKIVSFMRLGGKILYSGAGHRQQGARALHAGHLRLQIHTQYMQYLRFFHCINGCAQMRLSVSLYHTRTVHRLSCCCLHGQKYSHITQGLYCVQWRKIVSVGGIHVVTERGIVLRFLAGTRCFDVLNNVQTHFRAHPVFWLMSTGPRFILRPRHVVDHAPPSSTEGENEKFNTRYAIILTYINIDILKYQ